MPAMSMPAAPSYYAPPPPGPPQYGMPQDAEKAAMYQPQYAQPVQGPPPPQMQVVQQAPPAEPPKKHRFGKLGNTMANSAAGGVGFGAGKLVLVLAYPTFSFNSGFQVRPLGAVS